MRGKNKFLKWGISNSSHQVNSQRLRQRRSHERKAHKCLVRVIGEEAGVLEYAGLPNDENEDNLQQPKYLEVLYGWPVQKLAELEWELVGLVS